MRIYISALLTFFFAWTLFTTSGCATSGPKDTGTTIVDISSYPDLQEGDKNEYVGILQKELGLKVDNEFGPVTKARVIQFQTSKGLVLKLPGTVGPKTWAALFGQETPVTPQEPAKPGEVIEVPNISGVPAMAWDNLDKRKQWSKFAWNLVGGELWPKFSKMTDGSKLCSKYDSLTTDQKKEAVVEMIIATAYFESGWDPTSRMFESTMGYYSEGLLQLSYPDMEWAKYCKFDKKKDDKLYPNPKDPNRTILDPIINLDCGIRIMADQIEEKKKILLDRGVYWAVLKINGKYQKIAQIKGRTEVATGFCK